MTPQALAGSAAERAEPRAGFASRLSRLPLAAKLALAFIGLVALVLLVNGAIEAWLGYGQAKREALEVQAEEARGAADRVEAFLADIETGLGWTTGAEWGYAKPEQQRYDFIRLLREAPAITSLAYIDGHGKEQLAVSRLEPDSIASGKDLSTDPRFVRAVADKVWFGPVEFRRGSEPYMTIAVAHVGKTPGVTVADVNLKLIWDVISAIHVGQKGNAYVVDDKGRLIADPDLSLVLRDTDLSALPQVQTALAWLKSNEAAHKSAAPPVGSAEIAKSRDGGDVLTAYAIVPKPRWVVFVQQPLAEAFAPVTQSLLRTGALLGLGLLLALVSGATLARRMTAPIRALQRGAERLGAGDLGQRIDVRTGDEIESLAGSFNAMAGRLKDSYETLEAKVEARTRDLEEALAQQTATADVLKAISRSAFDLKTVLETLISTAVRICDASGGQIFRRHGDVYRYAASLMDLGPAYLEHEQKAEIKPGRGTLIGRVALENRTVEIADAWTDPEYAEQEEVRIGGVRAMLGVPLMRNGELIGAFALGRPEPIPFTKRQIELVTTFADQAVIAIENARLFDEVQARTHDLEESLAQQTATADVLKVISRSAFDLQTVLDTLVASAVQLNGAHSGNICVREDESYRYRAFKFGGDEQRLGDYLRVHPPVAGRGSIAGRVILSGRVEQIPDILCDGEYEVPVGAQGSPARALIGVPLIGKERLEGVFILTRVHPGSYPPRQVEILQTFADQAVIAIENARLFDQVQARTRELARSLEDLRKAQDRLVQSEKLASLGQLTAGIAHEIKNPLNFVNNFSALSRELLDELNAILRRAVLEPAVHDEALELIEMAQGNLEKVVSHGQRADSIVKNMLLHARQGSSERVRTNINGLVGEALNLAYHGARAEKPGFNVTIERDLAPDAAEAELYPQEITRVLLNLISNGFYATTKRRQSGTEPGYEPTITASTRNLGNSVEIAITDNGTGIPNEVRAKLFNPFFTTKPAGEGTGLGLSLSHDIVVKQHGGSIDVESEPGSTTFVVRLPRADAGAPPSGGSLE